MSRDCGRTIAPRIPIKSCDDESVKYGGSSRPDLPSASSVSMPPSTTYSICNDTSSLDRPCASSEPKRRRGGRLPSQQYEIWFVLAPLRPATVIVTTPAVSALGKYLGIPEPAPPSSMADAADWRPPRMSDAPHAPQMVQPGRMALQTGDDLALTRRPGKPAIEHELVF